MWYNTLLCCAALPLATAQHPFIIVTRQRHGSGKLVDALQRSACLWCARELFGGDDRFAWDRDRMEAAVDGFLKFPNVTFAADVGPRFRETASAAAGNRDGRIVAGFKWMLSQPRDVGAEDAFASWLLPLARRRGARLVFLIRRQLLDVVAANLAAEQGKEGHGSVRLPEGKALVELLDRERVGVATPRGTPESFDVVFRGWVAAPPRGAAWIFQGVAP